MKKNLLALLCVLSILVGVFAVTATAEETPAEDTFQVGYAKVDINPYELDEKGNIKTVTRNEVVYQKIMPVPLRGTGTAYKRLAYDTKMDDNGDGNVDGNDGLFATCIAISDSQGKTVLLMTMDAIGDMGHTKLAREEICKRIPGMSPDRIMISGTHSHGGVDLTMVDNASLLKVGTAEGVTVLDQDGNSISGEYANACLIEWRDRLVDHLADAAEAAIENQAAATVEKGEIEASTAARKVMNTVRHYVCTDESSLSLMFNPREYVKTDNSNYRPTQLSGEYKRKVSEVDQTLHVISFNFTDRTPIVLANWRCHPSLNSSGTNDRKVTSDYVNSFRHAMEQANLRPAFFQGAGGNSNPTSAMSGEGDWIVGDAKSGLKGNTYGSALAQVTLQCLGNNMNAVAAGKIETLQEKYKASVQTYTQLQIDAAQEALGIANGTITNKTWEEPGVTPYIYTSDLGTYCIASIAHANTIISYQHYTNETTRNLEINTLLIGPNIAIVTTPGESFDRYSNQATLSTANDFNDWDNLNDASYGTPLIFGYANQHIGYIPNALSYTYNENYPQYYAVGCYESQITPLAKGEGEIMVSRLDRMLETLMGEREEYCDHCKADVMWQPMNSDTITEDGHYYLTDDVDIASQKELKYATTLCIDLNGHTMTSASRAIYAYADAKATINIMDSSADKTGEVVGTAKGMAGGTLYIEAGSTLNIYSGKVSCNTDTAKATTGGVIWTKGNVNIHNGQILGGDATGNGGTIYVFGANLKIYNGEIFAGKSAGKGGTIFIERGSTLDIYDGQIYGGEATGNGGAVCLNNSNCNLNVYGGSISAGTTKGAGNCVSIDYGKVTMAGDADVAEIRYAAVPSSTTFKIVKPANNALFSGQVVLNTPSIAAGTVIGTSAVEWGTGAKVTIADGTEVVMTKDMNLVAQEAFCAGKAAAVDFGGGVVTYCETLEDAIAAAVENGQGCVVLGQDVEELTVNNNVAIDLNGKTIEQLEVMDGVTLKLRDRKTDDHFVGDHVYGVIKEVTGNGTVVGDENYLEITENKDTDKECTSYHCYSAKVNTVTLSSSKDGMYYKSEFLGDAMVAQQVDTFGVAFSVSKVPYITDKTDKDTYSEFTNDKFGGENNSTILKGIMKSTNAEVTNIENSQKLVYGRSYIKLTDGKYLYSDAESWSLKSLTEEISKNHWNGLEEDQKNDLLDMYGRFTSVMEAWDIENVKNAYDQIVKDAEAAEKATLKVLVLDDAQPVDAFDFEAIIDQAGLTGEEFTSHQVGVLWSEGCTMALHKANAQEDTAAYNYSTEGSEGQWENQENKTLKEVLKSDKWDVIVLPETSGTNAQYVKNFVKRTLGYTPLFVAELG